jgi:membrane-associated phospholipid phosphatase
VRSLTAERIRVRRRGDAVAALAGLAILVVGMLIVGDDGAVPDAEESVFWSINDLPGWLYPLTWPIQQFGVLAIGPVVAVIAVLTKHPRLAVAAIIATAAKLVLERVVKAMVSRGRPWRSIGPDVELRGDVSMVGEAFVSGHAIMAGAMAALVAPYLPGRWRFVPWGLALLVLLARIYVGAHNPLDVICGAALGVAVASCLHLVFGVPARRIA